MLMRTSNAVEHFGSVRALAEVLNVSPQAIYDWGEEVPELRAYQLEVLTNGALKAQPRRAPVI